jgi:hypothetical protein
LLSAEAGPGLPGTLVSPGILWRVFGNFPRHLQSTVPGAMTYQDYVYFNLAEKDRMTDTSLLYWFRCLDMDGDGFLSSSDVQACHEMKVCRTGVEDAWSGVGWMIEVGWNGVCIVCVFVCVWLCVSGCV